MATAVNRIQSSAGLDAVFSPKSVAVIGASPNAASVGHRLMASILGHGFRGPVYPIHPTAQQVLGVAATASVLDVPAPIDLAVVAVPAAAVLAVVRQCAQKGVRGLVVVSAGFRETGPSGADLEQQVADLARKHGMRLVGPNCLGIVNADPAVALHAIFSDTPVDGGPVAIMTQSGALGIALLERAHSLGLGVGRFASMGNKVDVSGNDLLLHWENDPQVKLILMHLESVGNPRNFVRIARRVVETKPILLVKGGRTSEGAKAAGSHTGAMMEADALVDAMVEQAGVVRVATVEDLFDGALALSLQPLPSGNRVGIVTNSGGPAILLADALPAGGLRLAQFSATTLGDCQQRLPAGASLANPLDMLAGASPETLTACLRSLLADANVDSVVAMVTPLAPDDTPWAEAILAAKPKVPGKTLVAVLFGRDSSSTGFRQLVRGGIPAYTFPENAAHALAALNRVSLVRKQPPGSREEPRNGKPAIRSLDTARDAGGWTSAEEALAILAGLGVPHPDMRRCKDPGSAAAAAEGLGFPVAIKVQAEGLIHKTEAGAVRLGLRSKEEVLREAEDAWRRVREAGHRPKELLVQRMAAAGTEMLVGAVRDPKFGPIVSVGLGGIYTEALRDVVVRLAPVTAEEADRMLDSLRCLPLLQGVRGEAPKDVEALRDVIVALGQFMDDNPSVVEVEVNPLRVLGKGHGVVAVDARLRLAGP
ncbi:MAG: acetate--CoA ligase family protein [Candidatus Thermoplasmatota archaeon]|jgi:acetyl coenzyme A synthetase (ADP forming)-like protein